MTISGIGQDGYVRIQKETTWGTGVTSSMTEIPCLPSSTFTAVDENIENENIVSKRTKPTPDKGRGIVKFSMQFNVPFSLMGLVMNLFLGASSDATVVDSTYVHTWLTPITGLRVGKSFTMQVAKGNATAEQFVGCVIGSYKLGLDNQGQAIITLEGAAKSYTEGVARVTTFAYPTAIPANFSNAVLNLDNGSDAAFNQPCNSIELSVELGLELERFKTGSRFTSEPIFNTIPTVALTCNIDADRQFPVAAHAQTSYAMTLVLTSTENAAGTTVYLIEHEIPVAQLNPETDIPYENDNLSMDLEFECSYGGTTTGSGTDEVAAEVRVKDATAAYA
tara:strand:- start:435 stop:1439 length:1005 start_codon:yes stop_codon:yes gene_type:complete